MNGVIISQIKMPLEHSKEDLYNKTSQLLKTSLENLITVKILKKSIDARRKEDIKVIYTVEVELKKEPKHFSDKNIVILNKEKEGYERPVVNRELRHRPIVIGSGPAGLFAALIMSEAGLKPIVLERGETVDSRIKNINQFFDGSILNTESNIQFGEGGAGTFSDGKINTTVKDHFFRKEKVLETFYAAGANEDVLYLNKPHIGTDYLVTVVKNIRKQIESLGGSIYFQHKVTSLIIEEQCVKGVVVNGKERFYSDQVVLAIGHSARDTFYELSKYDLNIQKKAFAIGLRIEHPQEMISKNQFGRFYQHKNLPVADYKLTHKASNGRGVYSFCMCPGGFVVNASSEIGTITCNGMSNYQRDEVNANSAIIVNVTPEDFEGNSVLAGVEFQRKWERRAFECGGANYQLPIQLFEDFESNKISKAIKGIVPNTKGGTTLANLNDCLPPYVSSAIKEGVHAFDKKIKGFAREDAVLTGVETRSSSPIRILRNDDYESNIKGLYPCGEGAGYAGGIMSAAMDGIKVAEKIINR
jgi:uncharacterized FAD-dependent dehydrogenase